MKTPDLRGPGGAPEAVSRLLDDLADRLKPFCRSHRLAFKPYEAQQPDDGVWGHNVYGRVGNREFVIQIAVNDDTASSGRATLTAYVRYVPMQADWVAWRIFKTRTPLSAMAVIARLLHELRLLFILRMPSNGHDLARA